LQGQLTTADIDKSQSFRHALLLGHCFSNRKKFHGCRTTRESPRNTKAQFGKPRDERPYWLMILDMLRHFTQYDHLDLSLYVHDLEIPAFQHNYNEIGKRGKEVQYLSVFVWNMGHEHFDILIHFGCILHFETPHLVSKQFL
jgi:hypothetical protein